MLDNHRHGVSGVLTGAWQQTLVVAPSGRSMFFVIPASRCSLVILLTCTVPVLPACHLGLADCVSCGAETAMHDFEHALRMTLSAASEMPSSGTSSHPRQREATRDSPLPGKRRHDRKLKA